MIFKNESLFLFDDNCRKEKPKFERGEATKDLFYESPSEGEEGEVREEGKRKRSGGDEGEEGEENGHHRHKHKKSKKDKRR